MEDQVTSPLPAHNRGTGARIHGRPFPPGIASVTVRRGPGGRAQELLELREQREILDDRIEHLEWDQSQAAAAAGAPLPPYPPSLPSALRRSYPAAIPACPGFCSVWRIACERHALGTLIIYSVAA